LAIISTGKSLISANLPQAWYFLFLSFSNLEFSCLPEWEVFKENIENESDEAP
jgi:hypothetical protein